MKIQSLSLIVMFFLASWALNAQTTTQKSSTSTSEITQLKKSSKSIVHSDYAGMEEKILKALKANTIPENLPKYTKGQSLESYKLVLKEWAKKNESLFTDDYKAKLKAKKKN
ncbi:MAG: hypothetical protein P1U56_26510 [Saprospiraceae bacterium]|nr:hypothetical protein [Saprospiraceae bacterium]